MSLLPPANMTLKLCLLGITAAATACASADVQRDTYPKPKPGAEGPGIVHLYVESDDAVSVYEEPDSRGDLARRVCSSPCDIDVDGTASQRFVIAGVGVATSEAFQLRDYEGPITIRVDAGSKAARTGGLVLTSIGGGTTLLGLLLMMASGGGDEDADPRATPTESNPVMIGGGIVAAVGGAAVISGYVLLFTSTTSVEVVRGLPSNSAASASRFEIDKRTTARTPRYWLGEF